MQAVVLVPDRVWERKGGKAGTFEGEKIHVAVLVA